MHLFVQACVLGLLTGGVYALMASGLTLAFGIMRVINVAQGALIILGAYVSHTLFTRFQIDPFVGVLVIAPAMFALGVCLQLAFLRPLREHEREDLSLLVTWAIALGIEGVLSYVYNTTYQSTNTGYANRTWDVGGYLFPEVRVYAFVLSIGIIVLLYLVLARTRFGRSVRATVQNPVSARLLGVDAARVSALGFGLSAATASAAGAVYGIVFAFNPGSHYDLISRLLSIIVLGGLGSLGGAVLAALFMGMAEAVFQVEISPVWSPLTFFVLLIAILLVRPRGLFGVSARGAM
jgi:branched-chain amino acid transport system permease protein